MTLDPFTLSSHQHPSTTPVNHHAGIAFTRYLLPTQRRAQPTVALEKLPHIPPAGAFVGFGIKKAKVASETHAISPGQLDDLVFDRVSVNELNERRMQKQGRRQEDPEAASEASQTKKARV